MSRFTALGIVSVLSFATAASALTFTPTQDNRQIYAGTVVFKNTDGNTKTQSPAFSDMDEVVSARSNYEGFFANARGNQVSELGSMYIKGDGFVSADIGATFDNWANDESDSSIMMESNGISAGAQSLLEILFSIDMDAHYDLSGIIDAGIGQAQGTIAYGSNQSVNVVLFDITNDVALVEESVTDSDMTLSNAGHLGPGNYRFTVDASVEVFSGETADMETSALIALPQENIYSASARFNRIRLTLSGGDQPIPEPVTTSLIGLSLGALALHTSRRRRA